MTDEDDIYLLDGYGIIYRAYFAFINKPLLNEKGQNISAIFGFFRFLLMLQKKSKPKNIVILFDSMVPTFRHEQYKEYKQNRSKTPDDLKEQIPIIRELAQAMGILVLDADGFEADDLIASVNKKAAAAQRHSYIVSSDKDLLQLVDENTTLIKQVKGASLAYMNEAEVLEQWGIYPRQIKDYLALVGDSSDNIPGVLGIGAKTAVKLLTQYEELENIYANIDSIKPIGLQNKLRTNKESAFISQSLVELVADVPIPVDWNEYSIKDLDINIAAKMFEDLGINSIADELRSTLAIPPKAKKLIINGDYETVTSSERLDYWIKKMESSTIFALDCETTGLNEMEVDLVGISLCSSPGEACYIPIMLNGKPAPYIDNAIVKTKLSSLLGNGAMRVVGQNYKYDYKVLANWGIETANIYFDTMIAAWLIDSSARIGMDVLALRYLDVSTHKFKDVLGSAPDFSYVPLEAATNYAAEDADITWRLFKLFEKKLVEEDLDKLFYTTEMPLLKILANMELVGISLDKQELFNYSRELAGELELLTSSIHETVGHEFNINSPKQLQEVLFEELDLARAKKTKTGYSTNSKVLERLVDDHPIIVKILRYRILAKLKSTYVDSLPSLIVARTGSIHTHYQITGAATGRLSSIDPNLQNIPNRTAEGRQIRKSFKPRANYVFLSADYSQIELVVLAHLADDPGLIKAFNEGKDVHSQTAEIIFRKPSDEIDRERRQIAKTINFGVIYGMSAFRLANELKISRFDADQFIKAYFTEFSGIKSFMAKTISEVEKTGYVRTMLGRKRKISTINSKNKMEKAAADRVAVNTIIQGSAADIVKTAMIKLDREFKQRSIKSRMLLQVHDEVVFEVLESEADSIVELIRTSLENVVQLKVPLHVSIELSEKSWGDLH